MDPLLFKAARDGNIEVFLEFLKNDPLILEDVAATTADTPLHIAAMLGHLDFENEVLKHKTSGGICERIEPAWIQPYSLSCCKWACWCCGDALRN